MDTKHLQDAILALSKIVDDNEKISLPIFSAKLSKAAEMFGDDYTIGMMNNVVARMSDSKLFISRAELKELYNKLYSRNTKFAEIFKEELGDGIKLATPTLYKRDASETTPVGDNIDEALVNSLHSVFGNKTNAYTVVAAERAKNICSSICNTPNIEVAKGDSTCIVCRASFETPKGITSVLIPVEIVSNQALIPSIFYGNDGVENLSKANLESYIVKNTGKALNVGDIPLKQYSTNVDIALAKLNAHKQIEASQSENEEIYSQVLEDKKSLLNVQNYKDPEIETFASKFGSVLGAAKFAFGEEVVDTGRKVILNKLANYGYRHCQVSVCNIDNSSISYAVSVNANNLAFKVPVKIADKQVIEPSIVIANGIVENFSKSGLNTIMNKGATDNKAAAIASPLHELKASDLIDVVKEAMFEENYAKAEDALNILAQNEDDKAYHSAMAIYTSSLSNKKDECVSKCSMIIRNANSKYDICGHTNLPLHKVWQDKNGNCIPGYRKGMSETYDGASFMHSKVLI